MKGGFISQEFKDKDCAQLLAEIKKVRDELAKRVDELKRDPNLEQKNYHQLNFERFIYLVLLEMSKPHAIKLWPSLSRGTMSEFQERF